MNKNALLIRNAYRHDFGGAERFPVSLATELKTHGYTPVVVSRSNKLLGLAESSGIETIKGPWWSRQNWSGASTLLFPVYLIWQFYLTIWYISVIIKCRVQIVHPQSRDDFIAATIAGRLLGRKVVWTDHADLKYIWQNHSVWYKNPVGKSVYFASKLAHHITLVSKNEKRLIEERLGKKISCKFQVIYNGVDDNEILPAKLDNTDKGAVIFSATSRMVTAKGIGELIEAFIRLDAQYNVRLWLLGEGPEISKFRKMAEPCKNIKFLGFPENALSYVAASTVFVHPSYHEGFSISLVESAMLGMPTIACNVGGNPEIIENGTNGILVPEKNSNELFVEMETMVKNAEIRKKYGDNIRKTYLKHFAFKDIVKKDFVPLYEI